MVADRVIALIARTTKIRPERITLDSTFDELDIDSLDGVELVFEIEHEFDINVPNESLRDMKSVRGVVEAVEALLARQAATRDQTAPRPAGG